MGRPPLAVDVVVSILKYYIRLRCSHENDLIYHAFNSQLEMRHNSLNTCTYPQASNALAEQLGPDALSFVNNIHAVSGDQLKKKIKVIGPKLTKLAIKYNTKIILSKLNDVRWSPESK